MASKFLNRNVIGILVITIIFGVLSAITLSRMYGNLPNKEEEVKKDYIVLLEETLKISLEGKNDFENLSSIGYDTVIEPVKYKNHYKPCFGFTIVEDGVIIKNAKSKDCYDYGFSHGQKITHINGEELKGKEYFDILDLLYATTNVEKTFTVDGEEVKYTYGTLNDRIYFDQKENRLYIYNLDKITQKAIHDYCLQYENLVLDLSMASVDTFDGIYEFVSLFVDSDKTLFVSPENIKAKDNGRKISDITIDVGENTNSGVLFALTTISKYNSNLNISTFTPVNSFYSMDKISNSKYTIYIYSAELKLVNTTPNEGTLI